MKDDGVDEKFARKGGAKVRTDGLGDIGGIVKGGEGGKGGSTEGVLGENTSGIEVGGRMIVGF